MPTAQKFIVLPFKKSRAGIVPAEMRQASNAPSAERIAASMASRFVGVVALSAMADSDTGDLTEARMLASFGETGDLSSMMQFSTKEEAEPEPEEEAAPIVLPVMAPDEVEPTPAINASSLILTPPPEPVSAKRVFRAPVKRRKQPTPSAGPLFEDTVYVAT